MRVDTPNRVAVPRHTSRVTSSPAPAVRAGRDELRLSPRATSVTPDPLPNFGDPEAYKAYVINLVAKAQVAEADLDAAREALNAGKASKSDVDAAQERLDGLKLQLAILRDQFELPDTWSRSRLFGGYGFDKEAFWKDQVEAIPGYEVAVPPKKSAPAPAPEKKPAPASEPAPEPTKPAPAPEKAPEPGAWSDALKVAQEADSHRYQRSAGDAFDKATSLTTSWDQALAVAEAADAGKTLRYNISAGKAFDRGTELSRAYDEALAVADSADNETYKISAGKAFDKATSLAESWEQALEVAERANAGKTIRYNISAGKAFDRATDLCKTPDEALEVANSAASRGYNVSAGRAYDQAAKLGS